MISKMPVISASTNTTFILQTNQPKPIIAYANSVSDKNNLDKLM